MTSLTQKQLIFLKNHKSVERITSKQVIFSFEFKLRAVKDYLKGIPASQTFLNENIDFFPAKFMVNTVLRWRDRYNQDGEKGLIEKKRGRKCFDSVENSHLSHEELLTKIELLEQENRFLKKLKALKKK